jgi:hypothetical protein
MNLTLRVPTCDIQLLDQKDLDPAGLIGKTMVFIPFEQAYPTVVLIKSFFKTTTGETLFIFEPLADSGFITSNGKPKLTDVTNIEHLGKLQPWANPMPMNLQPNPHLNPEKT